MSTSSSDEQPSAKTVSIPTEYSLRWALQQLCKDDMQKLRQNDTLNDQIRRMRAEIVDLSRENLALEEELRGLDHVIELLIGNLISVSEVYSKSNGLLIGRAKGGAGVQLTGQMKTLFEHMVYLLQHDSRYLARVATVVSVGDMQDFVEAVVYDIFGDSYNTKEERMLLSLFERLATFEVKRCPNLGSLFRSNTATTSMLTAYAKRGQGMAALRKILGPPLGKALNDSGLNLEINPVKVYKEIVSQKKKSGATLDPKEWPVMLPAEEASKRSEVKELVSSRVTQLEGVCGDILRCICQSVDDIPFGMRWICKRLREIAKDHFEGITRNQLASIVGGYIYLRFFNPCVVSPDSHLNLKNTSRLNPKQRRNMILVAKVLQNLSNGIRFKDKEKFMVPLNGFLEKHEAPLMDYFDSIVDIQDSMEERKALDALTSFDALEDQRVSIMYNRLCVVQKVCNKIFLDEPYVERKSDAQDSKDGKNRVREVGLALTLDSDDLLLQNLRALRKLTTAAMEAAEREAAKSKKNKDQKPTRTPPKTHGAAPTVPRAEDRRIMLTLRSPSVQKVDGEAEEQKFNDSGDFSQGWGELLTSGKANPLKLQTRNLLVSCITRVAVIYTNRLQPQGEDNTSPSSLTFPDLRTTTIVGYLQALITKMKKPVAPYGTARWSGGDPLLTAHLQNVCAMLQALSKLGLVLKRRGFPSAADCFLWECAVAAAQRPLKDKLVRRRHKMIHTAWKTIRDYHTTLTEKLDLYRVYVTNARKGAGGVPGSSGTSLSVGSNEVWTHSDLEAKKVLRLQVPGEYKKSALRKVKWHFTLVDHGSFRVELSQKPGGNVDLKRLMGPQACLMLHLEDLLDRQQKGQTYLQTGGVVLVIKTLISFLNKHFMRK